MADSPSSNTRPSTPTGSSAPSAAPDSENNIGKRFVLF
jgi:hypothetical protein